MTLDARQKGQRGEREIADMLNALILAATGADGDFCRNLQQTQCGGFDLFSVDYPYFAFEVKRVEKLTPALIETFWQQALRQAKQNAVIGSKRDLLPVLIYRQNRRPWRVRTYGSITWSAKSIVVDVDYADFALWFQDQISRVHNSA